MIETVEIRNFQSLRHVKLTLGRFTVIVGASSSGKTAFMRALRAVASNTRGTSQITRGATAAAIIVGTEDSFVSLEHAKGSWFYRVSVAGHEQDYTKLAGTVPLIVTNVLGISPVGDGSLNFAGQFDRPFLVAEPGAKVARILGELTNVDVILAGVKEANRTRAAAASTLRTRTTDLDAATTRLDTFDDLVVQETALAEAERLVSVAAELEDRVARLTQLITVIDRLTDALRRLHTLPPVPDTTALDAAQGCLDRLVSLLKACRQASTEQWDSDRLVRQAEAELADLAAARMQVLQAAGTCPTCGQPTTRNVTA